MLKDANMRPLPQADECYHYVVLQPGYPLLRNCYPMLTGSVCIASKTRAKMSTLQAVAPIPAFMAGSKRWLRRRNGAAGVGFAFEGISFAFWLGRTPRPSVAIRTAQRNTKV